jgi:hypothetical protein
MFCAAATSGSAGAVIISLERSYKHLVPPGPKAMLKQHSITPLRFFVAS